MVLCPEGTQLFRHRGEDKGEGGEESHGHGRQRDSWRSGSGLRCETGQE
jgi:hypothetical protein